MFESSEVYLIVDKQLKIIWVWAGKKSRLFHRYIAATWAGKLKSKGDYLNFKYEIIKEGEEPEVFLLNVENLNANLSRVRVGEDNTFKSKKPQRLGSNNRYRQLEPKNLSKLRGAQPIELLPKSERTQLSIILAEIKEMYAHFTYSLKHVEDRIHQMEVILRRNKIIK